MAGTHRRTTLSVTGGENYWITTDAQRRLHWGTTTSAPQFGTTKQLTPRQQRIAAARPKKRAPKTDRPIKLPACALPPSAGHAARLTLPSIHQEEA